MQTRPAALLLSAFVAGCGENWCARFNLDCSQAEAFEAPVLVDTDRDIWPDDEDCDPLNPLVFPGAEEICDGLDNDCDGAVDENLDGVRRWYPDADRDTWGTDVGAVDACQPPVGQTYSNRGGDCDDTNPEANPGSVEVCTTPFDDDCSGDAETNALDGQRYRPDVDGDGYGDAAGAATVWCSRPEGWVEDASARDCDDTNPDANPGAQEVCDDANTDEDCDGVADDLDANVSPTTQTLWPADLDGDGFGDDTNWLRSCDRPVGFAEVGGDCDDRDEDSYPGAPEACDSRDNDCDGGIDEEPTLGPVWYPDQDEDGFGDASAGVVACVAPVGLLSQGGDCDDTDPRFHPGAEESDCADPSDYNCDGSVGLADADGDGAPACADCDDGDPLRSPTFIEVCDPWDRDEDCSGRADDADPGLDPSSPTDWYPDTDGDGVGDGLATTACDPPSGGAWSATPGDCAPDDSTVYPGAPEVCDDGVDNDCDGTAGGCSLGGAVGPSDADLVLAVTAANSSAGSALAMGGDLDGDGLSDLVMGAEQYSAGRGQAVVLFSSQRLASGSGTLSLAGSTEATVYTGTPGDHVGQAVALPGDVDGDGFDDLVVTASLYDAIYTNNGAAWLLQGPLSSGVAYGASDAVATLLGSSDTALLGNVAAGAGDTNADGFADVLVAGAAWDGDGPSAYLFLGPVTGPHFASAADATFGATETTGSSVSLAGGADFDGDGLDDLAFGARAYTAKGGVAVFSAPFSDHLTFDDADRVLQGVASTDYAGDAVCWAEDADGDGLADLVVGAYSAYNGGGNQGSVYLVRATTLADASVTSLRDADLELQGESSNSGAGSSVAAGDLDGDGLSDLLVGASTAGVGGRGYAIYGPSTGTVSLSTADLVFSASVAGDGAGEAVAVGDVDGNGRADAVFASPNNNSNAGTAYLFRSFGL